MWGKARKGGLLEIKIIRARKLRKRLTDAELKLWQELRCRQVEGFRFRKQSPIGKYIVDFICHSARLIIEVDGSQHSEAIEYDIQRTKWLESQGYKVQRFWNNEVLQEIDAVMEKIWNLCNMQSSPLPGLPPQGGKGFVEFDL